MKPHKHDWHCGSLYPEFVEQLAVKELKSKEVVKDGALRLEIRKNWKDLWDLREWDLDGCVECSNMTYVDLIKEIERELKDKRFGYVDFELPRISLDTKEKLEKLRKVLEELR